MYMKELAQLLSSTRKASSRYGSGMDMHGFYLKDRIMEDHDDVPRLGEWFYFNEKYPGNDEARMKFDLLMSLACINQNMWNADNLPIVSS